jgi:hypothetical protein
MILIAESAVTPALYAVEQVRSGLYALCQLCAWVTLKDLEMLGLDSKAQAKLRSPEKAVLSGDKWWHKAMIEDDGATQSLKLKQSKPWLAQGFQLCLKAPRCQSPLATGPPEEVVPETHQEEALTIPERGMVQDTSLEGKSQNAQDILNMIRTQYQEALYMSQVRSSHVFHSFMSNTDGTRHPWLITRKGRYRELAHFSRATMFCHLTGAFFQNF